MYLVILTHESTVYTAPENPMYLPDDYESQSIYMTETNIITSIEYKHFTNIIDLCEFFEKNGVKDYSTGNWISNLNASYKILEFEGRLLN